MTGEWSFEEPATKLFSGDLGLVLKVQLQVQQFQQFFPLSAWLAKIVILKIHVL